MSEPEIRIPPFENRAAAARLLREQIPWVLEHALVVAASDGGQQVAEALEEGVSVRRADGFAHVAALPAHDAQRPVILVDDGELPPETLAAIVWSLKALESEELWVATPIASRYLEAALPSGVGLCTIARYTPRRDELFVYLDDELRWQRQIDPHGHDEEAFPLPPRRARPPRTGRPWDADEEQRHDALVKDGKTILEIATALGRTRGGVTTRIAQLAIRRGAIPALPTEGVT